MVEVWKERGKVKLPSLKGFPLQVDTSSSEDEVQVR